MRGRSSGAESDAGGWRRLYVPRLCISEPVDPAGLTRDVSGLGSKTGPFLLPSRKGWKCASGGENPDGPVPESFQGAVAGGVRRVENTLVESTAPRRAGFEQLWPPGRSMTVTPLLPRPATGL